MKTIEVHTEIKGQPQVIKLAEDATIEELVRELKAAGAVVSETGGQVSLWVEDEEIACQKHHRLHEHGIRHGQHVHCHHRMVEIVVNTRKKPWAKKDISFKEVVELAFGNYSDDPNVVYTVTYSRGPKQNPNGSMVKGQSVNVKNGMVFNVSQTNRS